MLKISLKLTHTRAGGGTIDVGGPNNAYGGDVRFLLI